MQFLMPYISYLSKLDIKASDTILIASNIKQIALLCKKQGTRFDPHTFINQLQKLLTKEGTLLFPAFNYGFSSGKEFDYYTSAPENMGSLSNCAFTRDDFIRTQHPVFSFLVWGKQTQEFYNLNNKDAFSLDSPFGILYQLKAKMVFIDIDFNRSFTYVHFVEHMEHAFYRYHKKFQNYYTDKDGKKEMREYSLFVRDLDRNVKNNYNPLGPIFEAKGISKTFTADNSKTIILDLYKAYDIIKEQIKNHPQNLVTYNN